MRVIKGDLIALAQAGEFDLIVHGCNCFCSFGAGIALQIRKAFPAAWESDQASEKGAATKLGAVDFVPCVPQSGQFVVVANAYTQFRYWGKGPKTDYGAVRECFREVKLFCEDHRKTYGTMVPLRIGYPRIGAGLGGGDWAYIARIIDEELNDENHTLVEYTKGQ